MRSFCAFGFAYAFVVVEGASFDNYFLLKSLLVECELKPGILANGRKLIQIRLNQFRLRFIDSFLYTHISLAKLGPSFELDYTKTWCVFDLRSRFFG